MPSGPDVIGSWRADDSAIGSITFRSFSNAVSSRFQGILGRVHVCMYVLECYQTVNYCLVEMTACVQSYRRCDATDVKYVRL